jgi:hypothetical protein
MENNKVSQGTVSAEEVEQDFKELNLYIDDLSYNNRKDAGHLWIAFNDKFNAFKNRILASIKEYHQLKSAEANTPQGTVERSRIAQILKDYFDRKPVGEYGLDVCDMMAEALSKATPSNTEVSGEQLTEEQIEKLARDKAWEIWNDRFSERDTPDGYFIIPTYEIDLQSEIIEATKEAFKAALTIPISDEPNKK